MFSATLSLKPSQVIRLNKAISDTCTAKEEITISNRFINTKLDYSISKNVVNNILPTLYQEYAELKELIDALESCKGSFSGGDTK